MAEIHDIKNVPSLKTVLGEHIHQKTGGTNQQIGPSDSRLSAAKFSQVLLALAILVMQEHPLAVELRRRQCRDTPQRVRPKASGKDMQNVITVRPRKEHQIIKHEGRDGTNVLDLLQESQRSRKPGIDRLEAHP